MFRAIVPAFALLALPFVAHAKTLEDVLVEKGVITKAEAAGAAAGSAAKVYWNNGTRFEFPDSGFTSAVTTYLQERYTFTDADEGAGRKNTSSFEQNNARVIISGTALHNEFTYRLEGDFVGYKGTDGTRAPYLRDAYIVWNAMPGVSFQLGQYKTFVSRQFVTASHTIQLPDEALASRAFGLSYQNGLSAKFTTEDKVFMLRAGIFNGESSGEGQNKGGVDLRHSGMVTARLNAVGQIDPYEETDVNYTEDFALSFGATYAASWARKTFDAEIGLEDAERHTINVDAIMKYQGFSLAGEFYWADVDADSFASSANPLGFYVQTGYFFIPKKFEIAARYSYVDCDDGLGCVGGLGSAIAGTDKAHEVGAVLNYYFWKHNLKAALAWLRLNEEYPGDTDDVNTNKWIFQVTSYF